MSNEINLDIENYNGPLDILLLLIRDKKMDIFDINLSELATKYVDYIGKLKEININLASEYLVMASTLIQIKAKMLLQTKKDIEEVKIEKDYILKQLLEYQQFKEVSKQLREKEILRQNIFIKEQEDLKEYIQKQDESLLHGNSDSIKLILQMRKMFERINANKLKETTIEKFNLSPSERRIEILEIMKNNKGLTFELIFSVPSINHFSITLLTILDMSRKQEIILTQNAQFGHIEIKKGVINE